MTDAGRDLVKAGTASVAQSILMWGVYFGGDTERAGWGVIDVVAAGLVLLLYIGGPILLVARAPKQRANLAIATLASVSMLLWVFSALYYAHGTSKAFGEPLTRVHAFYFAVTVMTTTGFGDIGPKTDGMRLVVSAQMLLSLLFFVGVVALVISTVVAHTENRQRSEENG